MYVYSARVLIRLISSHLIIRALDKGEKQKKMKKKKKYRTSALA